MLAKNGSASAGFSRSKMANWLGWQATLLRDSRLSAKNTPLNGSRDICQHMLRHVCNIITFLLQGGCSRMRQLPEKKLTITVFSYLFHLESCIPLKLKAEV